MSICLIPGTFDPVTCGHIDIINKALTIFNTLVIAVYTNENKKPKFEVEQRIVWISEIYEKEINNGKVVVISYDCLTITLCKELEIQWIVRGIRSTVDLEYEKAIADANRRMGSVNTMFLMSDTTISATIVRDLISNKQYDYLELFVSKNVIKTIRRTC